ncbi:unnamed protein product [Brassica oleracea]
MCAFYKRISSRSLLFIKNHQRCMDNVEISEVLISLSVLLLGSLTWTAIICQKHQVSCLKNA